MILRVPQLNVVGLVQGEQDLAGIEGKVGEGRVLNETNETNHKLTTLTKSITITLTGREVGGGREGRRERERGRERGERGRKGEWGRREKMCRRASGGEIH